MVALANPVKAWWNNAAQTSFDVDVIIAGKTVPMTVNQGDAAFADGALITHSAISAFVAPAVAPAQLVAYAEAKRAQIASGGISVNVAASGQPAQMIEVGTDTAGLALLANAVWLANASPSASFEWDQASPVTLSGAQVLEIQAAVAAFQQALFAQKTAIRHAIASGAITTTAEVGDPTLVKLSAWPANS